MKYLIHGLVRRPIQLKWKKLYSTVVKSAKTYKKRTSKTKSTWTFIDIVYKTIQWLQINFYSEVHGRLNHAKRHSMRRGIVEEAV